MSEKFDLIVIGGGPGGYVAAIRAAQSAGVERFVYHSVLHPQVEIMAHHWQKMRVEEQLFESGLSFTILQPAAYMQNVLAGWDGRFELDADAGGPGLRGWLHGIDPGPDYAGWLTDRIPSAVVEVWPGLGHYPHLIERSRRGDTHCT